MDSGHQLAFINQNFHSLADSLNPFTLSDGSNDRLLIGKDSNGNYVVKVSKPAFDAFDATDSNLIFNSNQDIFKIVSAGITTVPAATASYNNSQNSTTTSVVVTHNLGFIPVVVAINSSAGNYFSLPQSSLNNTSSTIGCWLHSSYYWTTTNTTLKFFNTVTVSNTGTGNGTSSSIDVKYFLLQETAN